MYSTYSTYRELKLRYSQTPGARADPPYTQNTQAA